MQLMSVPLFFLSPDTLEKEIFNLKSLFFSWLNNNNNNNTWAINWIILTKIFRGMSLGTTLRLPLGKRVVVMDVRRLRDKEM